MATHALQVVVLGVQCRRARERLVARVRRDEPCIALRFHALKHDNAAGLTRLLHDPSVHAYVTLGGDPLRYTALAAASLRARQRWRHYAHAAEVRTEDLWHTFLCAALGAPDALRTDPLVLDAAYLGAEPLVSVFTTCYRSGERVLRPLRSLLAQTYTRWEWVLLDDSNDAGVTFHATLHAVADADSRIRRYLPGASSGGYIGAAKRYAAGLCRGQILLELDHDDALEPDCIERVVRAFRAHPDAGAVYAASAEVYERDAADSDGSEPHEPHVYPEGYALGHGVQYRAWSAALEQFVCVARPCDANARTLRDIVGVANHPRAWRADAYALLGGHCAELALADDYELLLRTFLRTALVAVPTLGYVQYRNTGGDNFTFLRNDQIRTLQARVAQHYAAALARRLHALGMPAAEQCALEDWSALWEQPCVSTWYRRANRVHRDARIRLCTLVLVPPHGRVPQTPLRARELRVIVAYGGYCIAEQMRDAEAFWREQSRGTARRVRWWSALSTASRDAALRYAQLCADVAPADDTCRVHVVDAPLYARDIAAEQREQAAARASLTRVEHVLETAAPFWCENADTDAIGYALRLRIERHRAALVHTLHDTFGAYPHDAVRQLSQSAGGSSGDITFAIVTCKRFALFTRTMNSFLRGCVDAGTRIARWLCVDDNSCAREREAMRALYPFMEFIYKDAAQAGHARSMNLLRDAVRTPYVLLMEDDWLLVQRGTYLERCVTVLEEQPAVAQVLLNRHYAETLGDEYLHCVGGEPHRDARGRRFLLHEYLPVDAGTEAHRAHRARVAQLDADQAVSDEFAHWPHYANRPSLMRTAVWHALGPYDERRDVHFERLYAERFAAHGYRSAYLDGIYCVHIGRLNRERYQAHAAPNAYALNAQPQYGEPLRDVPAVTTPETLCEVRMRAHGADSFCASFLSLLSMCADVARLGRVHCQCIGWRADALRARFDWVHFYDHDTGSDARFDWVHFHDSDDDAQYVLECDDAHVATRPFALHDAMRLAARYSAVLLQRTAAQWQRVRGADEIEHEYARAPQAAWRLTCKARPDTDCCALLDAHLCATSKAAEARLDARVVPASTSVACE